MHDLIPLKATYGLHAASKRQPNKTAVIFEACSVTYSELVSRMKRVSYGAFTSPHFQGSAAIVATNKIEYLEVLFGLADVGVPVATINPKSTVREVSAALIDCNAKVLFIDEKLYRKEYSNICDLVITFGSQYDQWIQNQHELKAYPPISDSATFAIVYSSGTTGTPKGMKHSHRSRTMISYTMAIDYNCMKEDDIMLVIASLSNGGGCSTALACLNNGGTLIFGTQVHPDYIMRMVEQYKITCAFIVPTLLYVIVNTSSCSKYNRNTLRGVFSSAAPFAADLKRKATEFFGNIVYDVYASTECGPVTVLKPNVMLQYPNSVGYPVSGSIVEIRRDNGTVADIGEVGEVFAKTLTLFSGYVTPQQSNTASINNDGEFVSAGDLGYVDNNGLLYVVSRKNDMIITGGNNVYPEEVESIINNCPGVIESAVVGTPDDRLGEVVTAFIAGMPTADPIEYCRTYLANYKIPRKIFYIDIIPKNHAGKILRKQLRISYK